MYAHNLRNTRSKKITRPIPEPIKKEISPPIPESSESNAHDIIDRLKQLNKESINNDQIPEIINDPISSEHTSKINEIRIRRSMSVDVLKKRTPLPPIPEKSLTQREITIKSLSSMQTPVTTIRRKMSQTVISRTPQIKPPPIPPKPLKPFLRRKENPK